MKKSLLPLPVLLAAAFFSCGENKVRNNADSVKTVAADSVMQADTLPKTLIADLLSGESIRPANASDLFFSFNEKLSGHGEYESGKKSIPVKEARKRFWPVDPACDGQAGSTLVRFFELDSIRRSGSEDFGSEGQIVDVLINIVDTLAVSPGFVSVLWTMDYHTYEACPYSAGTYYMLSTYSKTGEKISTQLMGMDTGGGDAPYSFRSVENNNLFVDGSFKSIRIDTTEDGEAEGKDRYEITKQVFKGKVDKEGKISRGAVE